MKISLIQRIILGFVIIMVALLAISFSNYRSNIKMASQLDLTASTLPNMLDQSNSLMQHLYSANRLVLVHANQSSLQEREQLRTQFNQSVANYDALKSKLYSDFKTYPDLKAELDGIDKVSQSLFGNALQQLSIHDQRVDASSKASQGVQHFDEEWIFFDQDMQDLAYDAKDNGDDQTAWNSEYILAQGRAASSYLKNVPGIFEVEELQRYQNELVATLGRINEKASSVMAVSEETRETVGFYLALLEKEIASPEGSVQQQVNYVQLNQQSSELLNKLSADMTALEQEFAALAQSIRQLSSQSVLQAEGDSQQALSINAALALVSLLVAITVAITVISAIRKPLDEITYALDALGKGDLTHRVEPKFSSEMNHIVHSVNELSDNLNKLINQIQSSVQTMGQVAQETLDISQKTHTDIDKQRLTTDSVATAVTEMESAVHEVASHASDTSSEVEALSQLAQQNMQGMATNVTFVAQLKSSLDEATSIIDELSKESNQISDILTVIQGITEQTNLLALNAAIEAARAGEHGRGFAVVADEVRTLANRSGQSASEISELIIRLQAKASQAVTIVGENLDHADKSVQQTNESSESLERMVERLTTINDMSRAIATASEQQSSVAKEVAENIIGISDMAKSIAQDTERSATISESLNGISSEQAKLVSTFKVS
ncbi:methyl-accepting chemotaxis protein [Vibrio hippocampi]|uniref:Methyl-accepting chemotaxis protein n=1 Tax=Vibrio hippocampi TaxID=654686 RepID=A0ABM8ZLW0_9VIBR|nr:methyl-accepting chemotaxis protein [Vibrio hippocampi]CAH0529512.1 hypothetical protein VHP8226_03266 [Vibrio hippocampi]